MQFYPTGPTDSAPGQRQVVDSGFSAVKNGILDAMNTTDSGGPEAGPPPSSSASGMVIEVGDYLLIGGGAPITGDEIRELRLENLR